MGSVIHRDRWPCEVGHRDDPRPETRRCSFCREALDTDDPDVHLRIEGGRDVWTHGECREHERAEARRDERREVVALVAAVKGAVRA